jgi:cell division protein FtsB
MTMEDQYYRKVRPRLGGWIKRTLQNRTVLILLLLGVPFLTFVMFSNRGVIQRVSLESERDAMLEKIQQVQKDHQRLQDQSKALDHDPKAIEKVAREKYGMVREGETVYKVKKER